MTKPQHPAWITHFPFLQEIQDTHWIAAIQAAKKLTLPKGTTVFRDGDPCRSYLLVIQGSVRVQKISKSGKEIVLYRVEAGQTCILTTSFLLAGDDYLAEAIAETEVKAVAIPIAHFHNALSSSAEFRKFVFHSYGKRIATLMALVEDLAFGRMDARLAQRLLDKMDSEEEIFCTHYELAADLGTAREVISRSLKDFERHGWINLHRGPIEILERHSLQQIKNKI